MRAIVKIFSMLNWWIGSIIRAVSLGPPATPALCNQFVAFLTAGSVRSDACRSHHVDHAGHKAEQKEYDEPPRRCRQQAVETPAYHRSDNDAGDQLRRKPETARHRRGSGSSVSTFRSGLVSPGFAVVPNFGQTVIQTSEPCGKRSFIGRRFIATSISVVVRAARHVVETRNNAAVDGNYAPVTFKSRADHTDRI